MPDLLQLAKNKAAELQSQGINTDLKNDSNIYSRFSDIPLNVNDVHTAQDRNVDLSKIQAPYEVSENIALSQSTSEKWLNDLGRLGTGAASSTVGGFAMIPAFFDAASSGDLSKMYENGAVKWAESLDEWGQENFKNHYTKRQEEAYKEASIFEKLTYGEKFWGNSVLANAGFMIGAAVDEAIFSALTVGSEGAAAPLQAAGTGWLAARLARRLAEAGTEVMGSGSNLIRNAYRGFTAEGEIAQQAMLAGLKNGRQLLTSAGYESSVEALQFQKEAYNQVLDKKANELGITKEELENNPEHEKTLADLKSGVNSVANGLWLMNLATVGSSNAIGATALFQLEKPILNMLESVNPLKAFFKNTGGVALNEAGQAVVKPLNLAQKAFNVVKSPISEGTEEFAQGLYQDVGKKYLEDKYNPNAIDMILKGLPLMADEVSKRLGDTSHEGWEEFASGFMTSLLGLPNVGRFVGKKADGSYGIKNDKNQPVMIGGVFQGIAENKQYEVDAQNNANMYNALNKDYIQQLLEDKLSQNNITTIAAKSFPMIQAAQIRLANALQTNDKFEQNQAKHDLLAYAAIARDKIGQGENFKKDVLAQYDQHATILQKGVTEDSSQEEIDAVRNLEKTYQGNNLQEKLSDVAKKKKNTEVKLKDIEAGINRAKGFNLSPDLQDRMAVALSNGNNRVSEANGLLKALQAQLKLPNISVGNLSSNELYELLDSYKLDSSKHKELSANLTDKTKVLEEATKKDKRKKEVKEEIKNTSQEVVDWQNKLDEESKDIEKQLNTIAERFDSPLTQYKQAIDKLTGDEKTQAESLFNDTQRAINQHKEAVKEYNLIMNNPVKAQKQEDEAKEKVQRQIEGKPEIVATEPKFENIRKEIEFLENKTDKSTQEVERLKVLKATKIKREVIKEGKTVDRSIVDAQNFTYNELQDVEDEIKSTTESLYYMWSKMNENSPSEDLEITESIIQRVMELKSILSKLESKKKQLETNLEYYDSLVKADINSREQIISLRNKTSERISFIDTLINRINIILKEMGKMLKEYTDRALSFYNQIEKFKNETGLTFKGDESSLIKFISNASEVFSIPENEHKEFYAKAKLIFSNLTDLFQQAEQEANDIFNLRQQEIEEKDTLQKEKKVLLNEIELLNVILEENDSFIGEEFVTNDDIILEELIEEERKQKVEQEKLKLAKEKQDREDKEFQEMLKQELEENLSKLDKEDTKEKQRLEKEYKEKLTKLENEKKQREIEEAKEKQELKDKEDVRIKAEKESLERQKEQEKQNKINKEQQEKNNEINQKKLNEDLGLLFDIVYKGKIVDIEKVEVINPENYKGKTIGDEKIDGEAYMQNLKYQALAKLSNQRNSPYYSVQSITTIDRADDGYRLGIINKSQTEQIEKERQEKIKQLDERDVNSLEVIMPNNPNHKKGGLGVVVGQEFNQGMKIVVSDTKSDKNYDGRENEYQVITKIITPAEFDSNEKLTKAAVVEITLFNTKEEADKAIQAKYEKVKGDVGKKQEKINKEYDEKLKEIKQYELDLTSEVNEDEFEIVTAPFNTGENTKKVDKNGVPVLFNPRLENIPNQKGTTIAVVRKGTNKIIGFINDRIFQYNKEPFESSQLRKELVAKETTSERKIQIDKRLKEIEIPFLKPNTRELNPQFNLAWIGMEGKQAEIQDQLNLLSTLTSGSLVKTTEGKLRFPKDSATTNLTEIEQLFSNPKVASVSVFQRIYEGSDVLYQEWKYNRERKIWEAGNKSDQDRVDANTLAITYDDGHVSNISVNVSKENQEQNLSKAIEILEDKGSTTKSKVFFTINSDQISQVLLIERSVDNKKAVVKIISGTKGEKTTTSFEWGSWSEFDNLFNQMDGLDKKEALNLFKTFINAKLKISSDKAQLPLVYKLYTVSFNDESFDKEIEAGKYIIPKMEGKLSVVNVEKADIAANEGQVSKLPKEVIYLDNGDFIVVNNNGTVTLKQEDGVKLGDYNNTELALKVEREMEGREVVIIKTKKLDKSSIQVNENPSIEDVSFEDIESKKADIERLFVNLENNLISFEADVQDLFNSPTKEKYDTIIGNYEFDLSAEISDEMRRDIESKLRDVKKSFKIKETSETSLDEKIVKFEEKLLGKTEEKEYSQLEISTALEKNEGDFVDMLRYASTQKGRGWAAIINALNDKVPKSQISNKKSEITHQKAVEIFKEYFPNSALSLEDVEQVLGKLSFLPNSVVYGVYNGLVRLRQGGTLKDTPFFEGFRLVFNALITDKEKSQILEEARLKYFLGLPKGQKEIILKEFQRTYSPRLNNEYVWQGKELENYYLETMLAREFANKATTNKPKSFIQRLFDKIRSWLGINKIDILFNRILDKEFRDFPYNPKDNQSTIKTMLDVYSSESETGKDLMTSENAYRIANRIFSKMARDKMSFEKALAVTRQYYDDLADIAYNNGDENTGFILETLSNSMDNSSLGKANVEKLRKEVEDRKAILSFDPDAINEIDNENKDIAIRDGENFSQSLRELGGEMSASKKYKEYLSTIMYVDDEFDLFGTAFSEEFKNMSETEQKKFYIPVDFIHVYNIMLKLTAGKPKSEIMDILNLMKDTDKQLLAVVNQMNIDIANPQEFDTTLDMILSNLEKQKVQGKTVLHDNDSNKFEMVDENAQGIENSQINKWASEYEMRHVGKIEATKELKAVLDFPKSADEVYKSLTKYGFKVSRLYCQWCYGLKTGKYENEIVPKIATEYGLTTNQSILDKTNIEYIFDKIIKREEENAKLIASGLPGVETIFPNGDIYFGEKKNEGSRNKLKAVAFGNSIFDSSIKNLSYKNSENKTVNEIIARMQVGDFVNIINRIIKPNYKITITKNGKEVGLSYDLVRDEILALNNDNDAITDLLLTKKDNGNMPYLSFINSIYNLVQEGKDMENGEDMALKDVQDILIDLGKFIFHNNLENFIEKDDKGNYKQMEIGFLGGYRNTSGEMIGDTYVEDEKSKSKAGTTFSSANEQEKTLALLGVWLKGWYNPIVAAGKSMQFIFKGNKKTRLAEGRILNRTKDTLMNWFDQEIHRIDRGIKGQLSKDIDKYEQKAQKFFENKAFVDSLANTSLKEIYSAFIEVDSKDAKLVAAKLQEKKDFIEKYKTDEQFRKDIKEALFNFHNNLSINFANNTIGTIGINLPQVLIDKKEKFLENDLNEGTENHRLMVNALQEFYFDDLINSTAFYNTFIGDKAMSLKNYIDVNKRAGKHIAGGVSSETANRNIRAIGMKSIKQMLGVDEDFQLDKDWYSERENYPLKNKDKFDSTDTTDAESYQTVKANIDFYLKSNAKYTKEVHDIYEMINYGIEPSFDWWEKLDKNNAALQKRKMVYADFLQYVKTSVNTLTWQECSVWNKETQAKLEGKTQEEQLKVIKDLVGNDISKIAQYRTALPSRQKMFDLLSLMQKEKIDYVYHDSASKSLQRRIRAKDFGELKASNAHYLNPTYWKEQVATDGVKMEVVDGTQKIQLIFSEQNGEIKVDIGNFLHTLKDTTDAYKQYLANRIEMNYDKILAELQNNDLNKTINIEELKAGFVKALEKSGSTQQTIKFFKESNINLPHIVEKAESMFMSRVSKVLSHKKSGSALALASPKLYPIMRATTKIELSNGRTISENEVISTETYKKFSSEFIEGKNFTISRLRHGIKEGEHYYAEIILPANHPALAYMKDGFIPAEFADMVGIRIPTQDKHSMTSMKVVDILPAYKGSTIVLPLEIILLSGADFDIDKEYIYWYAGYQTANGWKKYGAYKTEDELYKEYIRTNMFKDFKKEELLKMMKDFALGEYMEELENNKYLSEEDIDNLVEKYSQMPNFVKDMFRMRREIIKSGKLYKQMLLRMEQNQKGELKKVQTNKEELDNDLLDLEKVMIHNNGNNDIAYTPSSMDIVNQAVQSHILLVDKERLRCAEFYGMELATFDALPSSEKVEKIQKFVREKGYINVYGNHSPLDKLTAYYNNDVGSKNIGVWALSNVVMQTLIKESKHITVDNGAYMLHGIRINDIISSFLSSATDNDKEQHAAILQLDQETCGIMFDLMWRQGLHPTVALGIIYSGLGGSSMDIESLLALNPNLDEKDAEFLNNLMFNIIDKDVSAEQIEKTTKARELMLGTLKSSTNAAKYTMALTTVMGLNKGFKSTISDNQTIVEAIKTLKKGVVDKETGLTLPKPYEGWDIVQSDPHLKEEVDKFEKVYDELTPKVFLVRNEKLRNTLEKMTASLKGMNYPTNRTKVYRDLISYVIVNIIKNNDDLVKNYSKIGGEEIFTTGLISKVKTILTPLVNNSLMKGLTAVKKVMKQGEFEGKTIDSVSMNTWLKAVRFVDEKMQNDYERFNRRPHALEEIKEMMEAGVSVDKVVDSFNTPDGLNKLMGTLARLMYIQSVVKEGLQFKSGSVNSLISTPLFAQTNGLIDRLMNEKNFEEITGKSADQLMIDFIRNFVADESNKSFLPSLYKQEYFMESNEQGDTIGNAREALKNAGFNFDEKKKVIPAFGINYGKVRLVLNETSIKAMLNDEEFTPIYESIVTKGGKDVVGYRNDDIKLGEKIGNGMYYTGKKEEIVEPVKEIIEEVKPIEKSPTEIANEIKANQKSVAQAFENENFDEIENILNSYQNTGKISQSDLDTINQGVKEPITMEEFNSMSKEEQENTIKCRLN